METSPAKCSIVSVTSNQRLDRDDYRITGNLTLKLRAEKEGSRHGRVYSVQVKCTDTAGNASTRSVDIGVAHRDHHDRDDDD